jgi:hypothetical protein
LVVTADDFRAAREVNDALEDATLCHTHPLGPITGHDLGLPPRYPAQTVIEPLERRPLFLDVVVSVVDLCDVVDYVIQDFLDMKSQDNVEGQKRVGVYS